MALIVFIPASLQEKEQLVPSFQSFPKHLSLCDIYRLSFLPFKCFAFISDGILVQDSFNHTLMFSSH